jgi:hypothetical protein
MSTKTEAINMWPIPENSLQKDPVIDQNAEAIAQVVVGIVTRNLIADADYTMLPADYLCNVLTITDTGAVLAGPVDMIYPALFPRQTVINNTAQAITLKMAGQTGIDLASGESATIVAGLDDVFNTSLAGGGGGGGGGYDEGTVFPGSPATNDKFFRTDLGWLCYYDGARWLTAHEFALPSVQRINVPWTPPLASSEVAFFSARSDYKIFLTRLSINCYIIATNNGSNYYTFTVNRKDAASSVTSGNSINTSADSANTMLKKDISINAAMGALDVFAVLDVTVTGSPGDVYPMWGLYGRLIVT